MTAVAVAVVGAGRVGLSLARALRASDCDVIVQGGQEPTVESAVLNASLILLAVPDDAITDVASRLAASGGITEHHVVLHTSGAEDRSALHALDATGAALGSLHPLQSFSDPMGSPELLRECPAIIEGDARAVFRAEWLATTLGMSPVLRLDAAGKRQYHAAAVIASNYLVVLADVAAQLARDAGLDASPSLFVPLMRQTLDNLDREGTALALTGPIRRGDAGTIVRHLDVLEGDRRELYLVAGRLALDLAIRAGLDEDAAERIRTMLLPRP